MAKLYNLARMSTATTGTGTLALGSPISGFSSFAAAGVADGETISYGIADGANSEVGTGVYTASGTTLTRSVTNSTNSNTAISLSGTAQVFITPRKQDIGNLGEANTWSAAQTFSAAVSVAGDATLSSTSNTIGSGGTGATPNNIALRGNNANGGGMALQFYKNTTLNWLIGHKSAVFGGSNTLSDLLVYNSGLGSTALTIAYSDSAVAIFSGAASSSSSTGALTVIGGVGVGGDLNVGGRTTTASLTLDTGTKTATATAGTATLNKSAGIITSESLTTAAGATYGLTLNNSTVAAGDQVFASVSNGTNTGIEHTISYVGVQSGTVFIGVRNASASVAFNGTVKISFMVIKN